MRKWNSRIIMTSYMMTAAIVALITGFVYPITSTITVIIISVLMRIIQGLLAYPCQLVLTDIINAQFSDEFDMVNGLVNMGYYSGHGVAEFLGCIIYDNFGYEAAYTFSAIMALVTATVAFCMLPNSKTFLSSQDDMSDDEQVMQGTENSKLTYFLIFLMFATMLINANYGVMQVISPKI
jgi:predicted MFS family arabinose efflux permease